MANTFKPVVGHDALLVVARVLVVLLFVLFGAQKLLGYQGTVGYFTQAGLPLPSLAVVVAIMAELGIGLALLIGLWTRPLALLLALYTLVTAFIGHAYWHLDGPAAVDAQIHFFKNVSIAGGLLLLYLTGAGNYSLDAKLRKEP